MTNPIQHGQVPEALIDLIDAYAETRHRCGGIYNARTEAARKAVIEALSGVQALSAAPAEQQAAPKALPPDIAKLRHLYANLKNGGVRDTAQAKRIADGLLAPIIERLEQAAPKAAPGDVLDEALRERDDAEDFIDALLDEVLGHERPEWSSSYGRADALNDVQERMTALHKPAVDKAWDRFQSTKAAPGEQNTVPAELLEQAYREGWAACRDAETIGEEAEDWAFGNSTANSRMIDAQQAAPKQEVQEPVAYIHVPHHTVEGKVRPVVSFEKYQQDYADGIYSTRIPLYAAPQPSPTAQADSQPGDKDLVAVPRDLIGAACSAIDKKRDGARTLAELRRYTVGDLSAAITSAPQADSQPALATQQAGDVVAYLDVGASGYLDLGAALSDEDLQQLPKGRHALVIAGAYGIDGYVAAPQQEAQEPYAYAVYFPDQPTVELVHDLDELTDDLTNREYQITKLYTAPQPAPAPQADSQRARNDLPREDFAWLVAQEACETEPADEDDPECIRILRRDLKSAVLAAFLRQDAASAPAGSVTTPAAYSGNLEQELAMLIRRIVSSARRNCEDGSNVLKLANEAWAYLVRKGLNGSPLRDAGIETDPTPPAQAADSVLEDAARLDWLALAGPTSICLVIDRPHDGEVEVATDDVTGYGKTLREAIDDARKQGGAT